jgi:hypothetical protein
MELEARNLLDRCHTLDCHACVPSLMADDESAAVALAVSISNTIDTADIKRNWAKLGSIRRAPSSPLLGWVWPRSRRSRSTGWTSWRSSRT